MLDCAGITDRRARRLSTVHSAPSVWHRRRLTGSSVTRFRAASRAEVHWNVTLHGVVLLLFCSPSPPVLTVSNDSLPTRMNMYVLHSDSLLALAAVLV